MEDALFAERLRRVKEASSGRWLEILTGVGVSEDLLKKSNRPCPLCGGTDRFSFYKDRSDGFWFCRGCGHGDGLSLLQKCRGERFMDTVVYLERVLGLPPVETSDKKPRRARKPRTDDRLQKLEALWAEARPLRELPVTDPVVAYLRGRGLTVSKITALRSHPHLDYWEVGDEGERAHERWPAMLARVTDDEGRLVTLHRTYLKPEGVKAPVAAPKKLYAGSVSGGLIRLDEPGESLGIAEGIETALSAQILYKMPVWSAISVGGFQNFRTVPEGVRRVVIFGDNDHSFAGQAGAYALAARLRRDHPELEVEVELPRVGGLDWNDVWLRRRAGSRRPEKKTS